ncbi:hypothetical protein BMS3Bbin06_00292 [bacterium BMS3Bbin06]|nr:hypothetical protein BMS3Bbin06_00292 [bacterium BMS3Bbin06]
MVRGINKTDIFRDDQDRVNFLQRLGGNIIETKNKKFSVCVGVNEQPCAYIIQEWSKGDINGYEETINLVCNIF